MYSLYSLIYSPSLLLLKFSKHLWRMSGKKCFIKATLSNVLPSYNSSFKLIMLISYHKRRPATMYVQDEPIYPNINQSIDRSINQSIDQSIIKKLNAASMPHMSTQHATYHNFVHFPSLHVIVTPKRNPHTRCVKACGSTPRPLRPLNKQCVLQMLVITAR